MEPAVIAMDLSKVQEAVAALRKDGSDVESTRVSLECGLRNRARKFHDATEFSVEYVNEFLQFVFQLGNEDLCSKLATVQILQEAFEASSNERCKDLFTILEDNIFKWKSPPYFEMCKNQILRLCNDLLKRLSRTVDTAFCGRILILLAKSFPLSEKSGLNLTSQFNVANATTVEEEKKEVGHEETDADADENNDMEVGEIRENKDAAIPVDYELYAKFWGLQQYFANPTKLYDRNQWKTFESDLTEVLSVFTTYKLEKTGERPRPSSSAHTISDQPGSSGELNGLNGLNGDDSPQDNNNDTMDFSRTPAEDNGFFAKYLTNQKLFHLQLADSQFRRYFVVQCLILANYLTSEVKFRDASHFLRPEQEKYIKDITNRCYTLLRETYPYGSQFAEAIRKALVREKMWSNWKNEGCPDVVTPLLNQKCLVFKRKPLTNGDASKVDLGSAELTRLWNLSTDNLAACRAPERQCVPQLKQFVEDVLDELDPAQEVDDEYKSINDEKFQWMAGRFLLLNSEQYLAFAGTANAPTQASAFLEKVIQKTAANIPELKSKNEEIEKRIKEAAEKKAEELLKRKAAEEEERKAAEAAEAQKALEAKQKAAEEAAVKKAEEAEKAKVQAAAAVVAKPATAPAESTPRKKAVQAPQPTAKEANGEAPKAAEPALPQVKEEPGQSPPKRARVTAASEEPAKKKVEESPVPKKVVKTETAEKPAVAEEAPASKKLRLEPTAETDGSPVVVVPSKLIDELCNVLSTEPENWRKLAKVLKPSAGEMNTFEKPSNAGRTRAIVARMLKTWVENSHSSVTVKVLSKAILEAGLFGENVAQVIKKYSTKAPEGNGSAAAANHNAVENGKSEKSDKGNGTAKSDTSHSELSVASTKEAPNKAKETTEKSAKEPTKPKESSDKTAKETSERTSKESSDRAAAAKDRHGARASQASEKAQPERRSEKSSSRDSKEREKSRERSATDRAKERSAERSEKEPHRSERSGSRHDAAPEKSSSSSSRRGTSPERSRKVSPPERKRVDPPSDRGSKRSAAASPERPSKRATPERKRAAVSPPRRGERERATEKVKSRRESR